jgi:hypothetical protein
VSSVVLELPSRLWRRAGVEVPGEGDDRGGGGRATDPAEERRGGRAVDLAEEGHRGERATDSAEEVAGSTRPQEWKARGQRVTKEGGRAAALSEGERKRRISQDCASGEGELHSAAVFAETARAATGAPTSANRGRSTGCRDRWRQSNTKRAANTKYILGLGHVFSNC